MKCETVKICAQVESFRTQSQVYKMGWKQLDDFDELTVKPDIRQDISREHLVRIFSSTAGKIFR